MKIVRKSLPQDHYTIISNEAVRDERLSWKARGLLAWLLSMRSGWEITEDKLVEQGTDGKAAVRSGLKELEELGYLTRARERADSGKLAGVVYEVKDRPDCDFQKLAEPKLAEPKLANRNAKEELFQAEELPTEELKDAGQLSLAAIPDPVAALNKIANDLAKDYYSRNRMEGFMGILAQVRRALSVGYRPDEVEAALKRIEVDGQTVTSWRLKQVLESSQERRNARMFDENGMFR